MAEKMIMQCGADGVFALPQKRACLYLLFFQYGASPPAERGLCALSAYYAASHAAYGRVNALVQALRCAGVTARRAEPVDLRALAAGVCGAVLKNGFYAHPALGTMVHIQCVAVGEAYCEPVPPPPPARSALCAHCDRCVRACPTGAISGEGVDIRRCVRYHLEKAVMPSAMMRAAYQLFGCEKCQACCPMGAREAAEGIFFPLEACISGAATARLKTLAGANVARRQRVVRQGILLAANQRYGAVAPLVRTLANRPEYAQVCAYAADIFDGSARV